MPKDQCEKMGGKTTPRRSDGMGDVQSVAASATAIPAVPASLHSPHHQHAAAGKPAVAWLEVHRELISTTAVPRSARWRARACPLPAQPARCRAGSPRPPARPPRHRTRAARCSAYQPSLVSEHACWNRLGVVHYNDLPQRRTPRRLRCTWRPRARGAGRARVGRSSSRTSRAACAGPTSVPRGMGIPRRGRRRTGLRACCST